MYAVYHGPDGLRHIGNRVHNATVILAEGRYFVTFFIRPSRYGPYYVIGYGGRWAVGVHTGFRTITLVLYIGSLPNLAT